MLERGEQRHRLEPVDERRVIAGVHRQPVGDEEQVELAAFGDAARSVFITGRLQLVVNAPSIAPAGRMVAGAEHEHAEMHLALAMQTCRHLLTA